MPIHDWTRVDAGLFHAFHQGWTCALCDALNAGGLPSDHFALIERSGREPVADVRAITLPEALPRSAGPSPALKVAEVPPRARIVRTMESEVDLGKANRVVVRDRHGEVVAVIEVVSPGNKGSVAEFRAFVEKMSGLIQQGVHAMVIDLFPPTRRDPLGIHKAIWDEFEEVDFRPPLDKPLTLTAYAVGLVKTAYVEPIAVGDELPDMPLFLDPGTYVPTPLEATYRTTWGGFPAGLKGLLGAGDD